MGGNGVGDQEGPRSQGVKIICQKRASKAPPPIWNHWLEPASEIGLTYNLLLFCAYNAWITHTTMHE